jgi:hypothetical protein
MSAFNLAGGGLHNNDKKLLNKNSNWHRQRCFQLIELAFLTLRKAKRLCF